MAALFAGQEEAKSSSCCHCLPGASGIITNRRGHISIDETLAREMNELSVEERERVLHDIHAVAEAPEETPELVKEALKLLDESMTFLPRNTLRALNRAMFLRPELEADSAFKLEFLRAESFDASMAAKRMANYFTQKQRLFGEDKLVKEITMEDLQEQDRKILNSGCFVELPQKDPAGRPILFVDFSKFDLSDQESMIRAAWYHILSSYNDKVAQTLGIVNIAYCPSSLHELPHPLSNYAEHFRRTGTVIPGVPRRFTSYHFCYNDPNLRLIVSGIQRHFGRSIRLRMRLHYGSSVEIAYSLLPFGISRLNSILEGDNQVAKLYDKKRREEEKKDKERRDKKEASSGLVAYPNPEDTLIGRGHPYHDFTGTRRLLQEIDSEMERYSESHERFLKTCLAMEMVKRVQEWNGRFLHRTGNGWKVLDDDTARAKGECLNCTESDHKLASADPLTGAMAVINLFRYTSKKKQTNSGAKRPKL